MTQPPEFWTTIGSNVLIFVVGGVLAVISALAFRRERDRSFWVAAVGFTLVTLGNVTIVIYQTLIVGSYFLGGVELLRVQTVAGTLVALGLILLLYSLYRY